MVPAFVKYSIHSKLRGNEKVTKPIDLKRTQAINTLMERMILWRLGGVLSLLVLLQVLFPISFTALAANDTRIIGDSGHPLPRFVSLKSNQVNIRRGPGKEYPVLWQFQRRGLPVEIIAEYELWRQIRDHQGAEGWVHASLLRGQRAIIVKPSREAQPLRVSPDSEARIVAFIQPGVVADLEDCQRDWCEIDVGSHAGWLPKDLLWGVYSFEYLED